MLSLNIILSAVAVVFGCGLFMVSVLVSNINKEDTDYKKLTVVRYVVGFLGLAIIPIMAIFFWTEIFKLILA